MKNRAGARYCRKVYRGLCGGRKARHAFFDSWKEEVEQYALTNPDCTVASLGAQYGTPEEVARLFCETFPEEAARYGKIKKRVLIAVVCACIVAVLIVSVIALLNYIDNVNYREGYFVVTVHEGDEPPSLNPNDRVY